MRGFLTARRVVSSMKKRSSWRPASVGEPEAYDQNCWAAALLAAKVRAMRTARGKWGDFMQLLGLYEAWKGEGNVHAKAKIIVRILWRRSGGGALVGSRFYWARVS